MVLECPRDLSTLRRCISVHMDDVLCQCFGVITSGIGLVLADSWGFN